MRIILNGINGRYLSEITDNASSKDLFLFTVLTQ